MAIALEEIDDVAIEEDLGYFFKRLGEICFSSASNQAYKAPLNSIATAGRCGAVFFSDSTGVYTARTSDVLANIQKWNGEGELNPHQASSICKSVLPTAGPASVSISPDEALLAICQGPEVQVFSTKHLVTESKCIPLAVFHLPVDFKQFAWQPDSSLPSFLVVCTDGALLSGNTASTALSTLPGGPKGSVACAAWSPSGRQLGVGSGDLLTVCKADGGECFSVRITSQEMDEEAEGKDSGSLLKVDSLHWLSETAILVSSKLLEDEEQVDIAPQCVVSWQGDPPKASGVHLSEFFAPNINVSCAEGDGPWLHVAAVQPWSTVVYCHRKSNDDHIKVAALLGGIPVAADITDDKLAIRIPNGPDDEENYVVGLGFDFTSTQIEVQHPTDPNAEDLPPQPVLFVGTSDGVLRAYTFGNMSSPTSIVSAALPLPGPPPDLAGPAEGSAITAVGTGGAGAAWPGAELEGKAAATALPSNDDEEDWEQVEREEGGDQAAKAAGVALPSSDDSESDLEEEDSSTGETTAAAAAAGSKPVFAFATSAAVAPAPVSAAPAAPAQSFGSAPLGGSAAASPAAPSFGFATSAVGAEPKGPSGSKPPQAVAPSTPAFSWPSASSASMFRATSAAASSASLFGATSASLFSASSAGSTTSAFGGTSSAPDSLATLSQAAFPLSSPAPPSVVTPLGATQPVPPPPAAAGATPPGSEPASGLPPQAESVASQASSRAVSEQEGTTETSQANLPAEPAKPAFKKTSVERPAAKLQGECPEAAELEADFLLSLHHTRKLEAQLHDAMAAALQHEEGPGSYAGFLQLRCQTQELEREVRALTDSLARQKAQFGAASHQVKDAHRKCDALPSFTPSRPGGDAGGSWELLMSQPLEPPLANLRGGIKAQLVGLGRKSQELRECLDALEDRQRQYKSGDSVPQKLTSQQLYNAVNSQVAIVKAQSERLEALSQLARSQGLGWEEGLEGWEEGLGLLEGPNAGVQLQLEALRLGESPLQGGGKRTPGSGGKRRSPWRLVRESPLSARRPSPLASSSGTPTQPAGSGAPFPSSRLSPAPRLGGEWRGWDHPGSKAVVQQILERVKSEEGGVRITASKPKPPPLELQRNVARSASPPTTSDAEAAQVSAPEPPREPPILPPFSLSSVPSLPPATQPSTGGAGGKLAAEQPPFPSTASAALGAGAGFGALGTPGSAAFGFSAPPASATSNGKPAYFIPSSAFQGAKPGYVFKLDGSGVGYYQDLPLPTAGSIFGKGSSKPASEPGKPPAPQAAPKQPPIPSMAQVKAAGEQMQKVLGGGAAGGGPKEASQKVPKPPAAAAPKAGGSLPPIPSLAQVAQAQKLIEKVAPTSAPAQPPPSSTAAPMQPPPAARPSSQPPIPSMAAAQAAQQRLGSFLSSPSTTPPAAPAPATTQAQQAQKQPSGAAGGELQQGSGDGGALAGGTGKVEDAQQAQQGAPAAELNFGGMGLGVGAAGSGGSPFGRGVSFGAAPTAGVASSAALFSTATSGPGGSAPFPFGTASSAAASGFGTSASGAGISAPSLFGAASSAAASPFGATSSAATSPFGAASSAVASPFGAASSAATSPFGVPSPSNPFGATQSQAGGGSAASPFGKPASPASPFGTSTGFGQPATPGFGAPATPGFGAPATPGFGKPATPGFGQVATPGFGQAATPGFGQAATPGFGQAATPGFGQPAAFGSAATAGAGGGSVFGAAGGAAPGGAFGGGNAFGAFAQQGGAVGGGFGQQQQQQQAGGGFGAFGGSATSPAGPKPGGNPSMWAMRK